MLEDNPPAHALYESRGWRLDGAKQQITFEGTDVTEVRYRKRL